MWLGDRGADEREGRTTKARKDAERPSDELLFMSDLGQCLLLFVIVRGLVLEGNT